VRLRDGGELVDREVERCRPRRSRPELYRRIEQEPHHVPLLALVIAHEELAASRRSFPRDALERVARLVLADLAQLLPVSGQRPRPARVGESTAAPAARRAQRGAER
jgi:hypothetical protein